MGHPFHCTRLFWLGLPVLLFLLWAWGQTNRQWFDIYLGPGWVWSGQGKLLWHNSTLPRSWVENAPASGFTALPSSDGASEKFGTLTLDMPAPTRFGMWTGPIDPAERGWFPLPRMEENVVYDQPFRLVSVPYWLLTGGYAVAWLGGVAGWQRRKSRLMRTSAAAPPP